MRITLPGQAPVVVGSVVLIEIPKAVLVLDRRTFIEALKAGKRWRRHQSWEARTKAEER
jgi:hypothetical protein